MYTEMIFPRKNVRFIAINDGVDSAQGDNDFAPLRNIFNEWLVRDTSKKIRAVKRSKGMSGKPVTSKPVYGYLMDEDENFIIDEEAAPVVKQIYSLIRTDLLTEGVTENLRKVTSYATKHEARFMKLLTEQTEDGSKRRNAAKKKELEAAEKRIAELSAIFKRLYEDSVTGRISDERFTELSADYEAEQKELKERATVLQGELSRTLEATANAEKFMKVVRKYTSFEELTPTLLREFVEKIVIHESEALDGKRRGKLRRQEIEIYYSFVGKVELPD